MSGAAPWSVKGIEPKTREVAKDLARRSGMTLGEWLSEMIADNGEDEYAPLSRRSSALDDDRRARSRRLDDGYGYDASALGAIEALSARIEAAERRSTLAIDGVDKAVGGLVRRMESIADDTGARDRRIDNIGEELREGRSRLRQLETDLGPKNADAFGKIDTAIGKLSGQFYEAEQRGRDASVILRERMDKFERDHAPERLVDNAAARVAARLEEAQARTAQSLARLELSFADLDRRMTSTERNGGNAGAGVALERLAESLSRKVEESRLELIRRMEGTVSDSRLDKFERAMAELADHVQASEKRSVEALETMGREVLRIAENLNHRVSQAEEAQADSQARATRAVEAMGQELSRSLTGEVAKVADAIEQRMRRADDQHALALERLGGEISRISERLAERIALGERRAAQGVEELAERVNRASEKMESRYDRASGELGERMRQSEERTASLLAEARDSIDRQLKKHAAPDLAADWRDPAFPSQDFSTDWPGAPVAATDPGFPSDPGFLDEPALMDPSSADDDVFEPAPAFAAPSFAETETVDAAPEPAQAEPDFAEPVFTERVHVEQVHLEADEDTIDDEVLIETMPAFEPAQDITTDTPQSAIHDTALASVREPISFEDDIESFEAEPAFAAQAPGRPLSTREALAAARATVTDTADDLPEEKPRGFRFGLGGKSRLQKRMDKQAKSGSTMRTAMIATTIAVVTVGAGTAGVLGYRDLVAQGSAIPSFTSGEGDLLAAAATSPTTPVIAPPAPEAQARGLALFQQATPLIEVGDAEGVRLMSQAANLGYPQAQFAMARLYETGEAGVTADPVEVRRWTERAARGGEAHAMHNLALYMYEGTGGQQDQAGALQWFQAAAERGLVDSQYNLGRLYERGGEGLSPDPAKAYQWYIVAARSGDTEAQAGVERLRETLSASDRLGAEAQAERFQAEVTAQG